MRFEALQARYGDCLLLTLPGDGRSIRLLVDGGPASVFRSALKPRLDAEVAQHGNKRPLVLDAVMVSHIDEDHVLGLLDLFGAIQDADQRRIARPYQPTWLLHNSLDSLLGEGEGGAARALGGETVLASVDAALQATPLRQAETARLVLQSYGQGSKLASLAAALKISRNPPDQGIIGFHPGTPRVLKLGKTTLTVVGPLQPEIDELRKEWSEWKVGQKKTASLAAYLDDSVPNLSSIVVVLDCEGDQVLLTGDARGDHILKGLDDAHFLPPFGAWKIAICKLPHHGSARNLAPDFFARIHADHYVASGDGTYGNPDRVTLEMIEAARPDGGFHFHLTYPAQSCDEMHKAWRNARPKLEPYNHDKHAIAPTIARWRAEGKITVGEGKVEIDL